jgi:REP element-mobilizing transposase RayT
MRYRDYKDFHKGGVFHVYNRGHNKETIFKENKDYLFFLTRVRQILGLQKFGLSRWMSPLPSDAFNILAYCLMPNHFHFLICQETNLPISKFVSKLCISYSAYFNTKYENIGSVFQDQFKAKFVDDDAYLMHLSTYIHNNPKKPHEWPYSSLSDYLNTADIKREQITKADLILNMVGGSPDHYGKFMKDYNSENELQISHLTFDGD